MKSYNLETTMNFGKYKGKTLREILTANPNYVNWCLINVDYFHISNSTLTEIEINEPCFKLNKEALEMQKSKEITWSKTLERDYRNTDDDDVNWAEEAFDVMTDGMLGDWEDFDGDYDDAMLYQRG